jgi:serine O-acetyltransferase
VEETLRAVAGHLRAQREKDDPVSQARRQPGPDEARVLEVLGRFRQLLVDAIPDEQLESELEVVHGLLAPVVGGKAETVISQIPEMRHCVAMDVDAAFQGDPAAKTYAEIITAYPSTLAVTTYRIAHALYGVGEPVVARIMSEEAHGRTGIDIHPGATIGCHFFIDHGTGVVIGETSEIGNRVKLYHGVTLGAFSTRKVEDLRGVKRHPTLEDDVTVYPNATILGGQTAIGRCSVIGANVWLARSVPPYTKVMIEPPRLQIIQEKDRELEAAHDWQI